MSQWIIRTDAPFAGFVQTYIRDDGFVAYADGNLTPEQYGVERGFPIRVLSDAELDAMLATWTEGQITEPAEETLADFTYALECLPPCRWQRHRGVEIFHISEGVSHDLVQWHACIGERCCTFVDRRSTPTETIAAKAAAFLTA